MRRALSATAARVRHVTRQGTVERPDFAFFTEHAARAPGRLPFAPDLADVPATPMPGAAAGAEPERAAGVGCRLGGAAGPFPAGAWPPPADADALPLLQRPAVDWPVAVWL